MTLTMTVLEFGFANDPIKPISTYAPYLRIKTFPIFYGIVAFGYTIHGLALDIHSSMRDPSKYTKVLDLSMLFVTIIYLLFGSLAYLFFGYFMKFPFLQMYRNETKSVITLNLGNTLENDIIKLSLSVVLLFAYPLQMFPVVQIVEGGIFRNGENRRIKNNGVDTALR